MDRRFHCFERQSFLKWYHKCAVCGMSKIWMPKVKCADCKLYSHRVCLPTTDCPSPPAVVDSSNMVDVDLGSTAIQVSSDDGGPTTGVQSEETHRRRLVSSASSSDTAAVINDDGGGEAEVQSKKRDDDDDDGDAVRPAGNGFAWTKKFQHMNFKH